MDVLRLSLRQLQIFVAVARRGSTTGAGDEVSLSQSAVSSAVNELERLLSLQLFDRVGKRLQLNDNGRALLPKALALLDGAAGIELMARQDVDQAQSLRIGASTTLGNHVLPGLLGAFLAQRHRQHPHWRSSVAIGNTAQICQSVANFELDVGLIEGPCHEAALDVAPWRRDELVLLASPDHARALGALDAPLRAEQLAGCVWLLRESGSGTREAADPVLLPVLGAYRRSIEMGSSEAIKLAAAQGLGVACLSRWAVADWLESGRLVVLPTPWPPLLRQCYRVLHRDKQITPALQRFLDILRQHQDPAGD